MRYGFIIPARAVRIECPATELDTYAIDDVIRVPIVLGDKDGVSHVRAI